jgi:hypothetical protein
MSDLKARRLAEQDRVKAFRVELESNVNLRGVSEGAKDKIWTLAWEYGHASGLHEVQMMYEDFAEIAALVVNGAKP